MKIVTEALTYSNEKVTHSAVDAFLAKCRRVLRKLFRRVSRHKDVPNFTPEQLERVHATVIKQAHAFKQLGISEEQAQLLAALVVEKLAIAQSSKQKQ
jgi:hypothetical protein